MMITKKIFIICFALFFIPFVSGTEKEINGADVQKYLKQVEQFFNSISTFKSDFIEISSKGWQSSGSFCMKRQPAMLKMDYKIPPTKIIIVKNNKVIYYDKELKEKSVTSVYSSPLAFFLDSKVNICENLEVISCLKMDSMLVMVFRKKDDKDEENGVVALIFSLKPFQLTGWEIYRNSAQMDIEIPIRVYLKEPKINQKISDDEFNGYD